MNTPEVGDRFMWDTDEGPMEFVVNRMSIRHNKGEVDGVQIDCMAVDALLRRQARIGELLAMSPGLATPEDA